MPDLSLPRISYVTLEYDGRPITKEISSTLLNITWTDRATGEADDLDITLTDREQRWITDWYPKLLKKGDGVASSGGKKAPKTSSKDDLDFDWDDVIADMLDDGED